MKSARKINIAGDSGLSQMGNDAVSKHAVIVVDSSPPHTDRSRCAFPVASQGLKEQAKDRINTSEVLVDPELPIPTLDSVQRRHRGGDVYDQSNRPDTDRQVSSILTRLVRAVADALARMSKSEFALAPNPSSRSRGRGAALRCPFFGIFRSQTVLPVSPFARLWPLTAPAAADRAPPSPLPVEGRCGHSSWRRGSSGWRLASDTSSSAAPACTSLRGLRGSSTLSRRMRPWRSSWWTAAERRRRSGSSRWAARSRSSSGPAPPRTAAAGRSPWR